jgi:hypothetical protein
LARQCQRPTARDDQIAQLVGEGFDPDLAARALILTKNDLSRARDFILVGAINSTLPPFDLAYHDSPLVWLVLEVCEAFFDLETHCCICGTDLQIAGVKASVCPKPVCLFAYRDIGLGSNVIAEIRRDPDAADLILSLASVSASPFAAYGAVQQGLAAGTTAALPQDLLASRARFFERLPGVHAMGSCESDQALQSMVGRTEYEILRYIFLSLRSHVISLPADMKLKECANQTDQFLVLMSSPERELVFQAKKKKDGALYLWHGSPATAWLSILQNGLGLRQQGIVWHATSSAVSFGYSKKAGATQNKYASSKWKGQLLVIGFVESVKGKGLQGGGQIYTQTDLDGLALRVIMVVKSEYAWDTQGKPPKFMPSQQAVLQYLAKHMVTR